MTKLWHYHSFFCERAGICIIFDNMSGERIHYINGIRGILAVIVFIHHFVYAFCPSVCFGNYQQFSDDVWGLSRIIACTPLNIIFNPGTAINFFFLLSGYVQSHHYFKTKDIVFVQRSAIKRYFRLAVPVLAVVVLVFIFHKLQWIHKERFPYNPLTSDWIKSMLPDNLGFFGAMKFALIDVFLGVLHRTTRFYGQWRRSFLIRG